MMKSEVKIAEISANFDAFKEMLPSLISKYPGKFALLRKKEVIEYFDSAADALKYAEEKYDDGVYSIQEVTDRIVDLGYFSHAIDCTSVQS